MADGSTGGEGDEGPGPVLEPTGPRRALRLLDPHGLQDQCGVLHILCSGGPVLPHPHDKGMAVLEEAPPTAWTFRVQRRLLLNMGVTCSEEAPPGVT